MGHLISEPKFKIPTPPPPLLIYDKSLTSIHWNQYSQKGSQLNLPLSLLMHKLCACAACESEDYDMTRFGKTKTYQLVYRAGFIFSLFSGEQRRTRSGRRVLETLEGTPASRSPSLAKKRAKK